MTNNVGLCSTDTRIMSVGGEIMSKWIGALFVASFVVSAMAEGTYEENTLGALHYRSAKGASLVNANLATRIEDSEAESQNGNTTFTVERTSWQSTVTYYYGISDILLVGISESYLFGTGISNTRESNGVVSAF